MTIVGPSGLTYPAIGGGGISSSLGLIGNAALSGAYSTGVLSVGKRIAVGAGSSSVSYVYAAGALIVATSLTASTVNLASGSLGLAGTGATLAVSGAIAVGAQGAIRNASPASYDPGAAGSVTVATGTILAAGTMAIAQGSISVSGAGAYASLAGALSLGAAGMPPIGGSPYSFNATGSVSVTDGGVFAIAAALTEIAGSIHVGGAGSRLTVQQTLTLGLAATTSFATASLNVANGGSVQAGSLVIQAPASFHAGTEATAAPAIFVDASSSLKIGSGVAAAGTITIDAGKSITVATDATISGAIVDNGVLSMAGGNLTLTGNLSGTGALQIGKNGSVTMNGNVAASLSIVLADATAALIVGTSPTTLKPYAISAPISGFQLGSTILFGVPATGVAYLAVAANLGSLTLRSGSLTIASLVLTGAYSPRAFVLGPTTAGRSSIRCKRFPRACR